MACRLAQKLAMSVYRVKASGVILHARVMDSYISHRYDSNTIPFSFLCLASGPTLRTRYLAPPSCDVLAKTVYSGSHHPMKVMRVISHE
jgi:hypothetical protein